MTDAGLYPLTNQMNDKTSNLFRELHKLFAPPPKLMVSDWADNFRKLSTEASAESGQWHTARAEYQREIMNAISDTITETVVVMSSSQVGKSEILLNTIGYYIDYDPCPMLMVQPTVEMAETFSKDRIEPMLRDTPVLKTKVSEAKSRDKNSTILNKRFSGGQLHIIGSNAPASLASRPIRVILADEVDRFPASAGKEGDPLNLAIVRSKNFLNRKLVIVSTPTIKDASRIEREYLSSSAEVWHKHCPACGELQSFEWGNVKFEHHGDDITVHGMVCTSCGVISEEWEWKAAEGKWVATYPERKSKRGFYLNELTSPWSSWESIVKNFLDSKGNPETLKTWVNTTLGQPWEEYGELDSSELLEKRREMYNCEVPEEVVVLTAGVDVQDNRLEYEIVGWSKGYESYGIYYGVIMGDPVYEDTWEKLDDVLAKKYKRADGLDLQIMATCVDTGGSCTSEVYKYCKNRESQRVFAIKGQGGTGIPFISRPKTRNKAGVYLFMIGVNVGKDTITGRLKTQFQGPHFCHFPMDQGRGYDKAYFEGLTSERRVTHYVKGRASIQWEKRSSGVRNEPFDLRNYATAAFEILNPQIDVLYERLNSKNKPQEPVVVNRRPTKKQGVVNRGI